MIRDDIFDLWDDYRPYIIAGLIILAAIGIAMAIIGYMIGTGGQPRPPAPTWTPTPTVSPDRPTDYNPIVSINPNIHYMTMNGATGRHEQALGVIESDTPAYFANGRIWPDEIPAMTTNGLITGQGYYNTTLDVLKYYFIPQNKSDLECQTAGDLNIYWGEPTGYVDKAGKYHEHGYYSYKDNTATVYAIYNGSMVKVIIP